MITKYGLYDRNTKRHKWRLASIVFNKDLANRQAAALVKQARANGYETYEVGVVAAGTASPVKLPEKLPAGTSLLAYW